MPLPPESLTSSDEEEEDDYYYYDDGGGNHNHPNVKNALAQLNFPSKHDTLVPAWLQKLKE